MSKPNIRLYVVEEEGQAYVAGEDLLLASGLDTDEKLLEAFGENGSWKEIWLRSPTVANEREIKRKTLISDAMTGFREDPTLMASARAEVMIERWNGFKKGPSMATFDELPAALGNAIDNKIATFMYPNIVGNKGFLAMWNSRSKPCAENSPSSSPGVPSILESPIGSAGDSGGPTPTI